MIVDAIITYIYDKKFVYQFIATLSTFITLKIANFAKQRYKRYKLFEYYGIPGPKPSMLDGCLNRCMYNNAVFLRDEMWVKEYGKIFGIFIGDEPILIVADPVKLKKIFFEETKIFCDRSNVFLKSALTEGILFAKYPRWKFMRKVMSPPFNSYTMRGGVSTQFVEDSIRLMTDYIDRRLDEAKQKGVKASIDIHNLMKSTALYLITSLAINLPNVQVKENEENVMSLDEFLSTSDKGVVILAIMFPFIRSIIQILFDNFEYSKTMALIHSKVNKTIDEELARLKKSKGLDSHNANEQLINTLIKLHYEGKMSRIEIMGNIEALLFAGYDTTSTTLTYIFWVLAKYPDIQEKLRYELMAHGIESKYLEQVIKETMRLYPTVMIFTTRLATSTAEVDGLIIPEGTKVVYNSWLMHKDPTLWPEPDKFDPERFREGVEIHPCAYAPFGLSDKRCLGYQLAMLEMKMITCDILLRYKLNLVAPAELNLVSYAISLSKPRDKVMIDLEKL